MQISNTYLKGNLTCFSVAATFS